MQVYLPIAEIPVNIMVILIIGFCTGILSGMFGIGGGFLATPLLIFSGIPPAVAVSTSANQITAASISGLFCHLKKNNVDIKMALTLIIGGIVGSIIGIIIFKSLQNSGQSDVFISIIYIVFLTSIGSLMMIDSIKSLLRDKYEIYISKKPTKKNQTFQLRKKINNLPLKIYYPKSNISISLIIPIFIGMFIGSLVSIMGIGGGFIMIPAMIYILKMPKKLITGTSLLQIVFISINVTFMQAVINNTVDIVLASLMIFTSVIGAQIGVRKAGTIDDDNLKSILALLILLVSVKMFLDLFLEPNNLSNIELIK